MAGDGQMDPDDLEGLVGNIISGKCEHVKGDRSAHDDGLRKMPLIRRLATTLLSFFTTLAAGQTISDPQCGYTATNGTVLRKWNWKRSWKGYGYPNYWLIQLAKHGWKIKHHPVRAIYEDQTSQINNIYFFFKVGLMMTIEHHTRNLSWLFSRKVSPHTIFACISYFIGWMALIPGISTDLERSLVERGIPIVIIVILAWLGAIQDAKKPLKEFKKLAKKYSTCSSGSKKGDLGEFIEGQMVQDFEDEVWSMQPETIPQRFIKTQFGFHIIWVHSITLPDND